MSPHGQRRLKGKEFEMKNYIMTIAGLIGSALSYLFGGWTAAMTTLCIFMAIDFVTGIIVAAVFKNSPKSSGGALTSHAAFIGIVKKCMILVFVLIGARLDAVLGMSIIRDGVCTAFILSELISITENAGLMGLPVPKVIMRALEILKDREEDRDDTDNA